MSYSATIILEILPPYIVRIFNSDPDSGNCDDPGWALLLPALVFVGPYHYLYYNLSGTI
jgi:hypothetical protein